MRVVGCSNRQTMDHRGVLPQVGGVPLPSVGQSDLVSNPPQHEEMDDIFPLDACRRLEVL